jgi:hypothetical protein
MSRMTLRSHFASLLLALAGALSVGVGAPAIADVYMWKDPATGKTYMTNLPPPWLRDPQPGRRVPKVEVIREGKVLDPATAFAKPEPPPLPTRRRTGETEEAAATPAGARSGAQGTAGSTAGSTAGAGATVGAGAQVAPGAPGVPMGAPPPGMMLVPVPGAQNPGVQDPPTQMNVPVTVIR